MTVETSYLTSYLLYSTIHSTPIVDVRKYGADGSGRKDSTIPLQSAINACRDIALASPSGTFPGSTSFGNNKTIGDAGGCLVDLRGGEYMISSSLNIPEYVGNMAISSGSLVASSDFPTDQFLLTVGGGGDGCHVPQGSCNVDINLPEMFLDGSNRAAGCIQVNSVMGTTIGPGSYLLNFTAFGVQINGGHEVMIDRTWIGETNFDYDFQSEHDLPTSIGIQVNGNDHYILNTIVFSSKIGVEINGAANLIVDTHVWFPMNAALPLVKDTGANIMAFHVTYEQNRFVGCYIDGSRAVFEGGGLKRNIWVDGFECCAAIDDVNHGIILKGRMIYNVKHEVLPHNYIITFPIVIVIDWCVHILPIRR